MDNLWAVSYRLSIGTILLLRQLLRDVIRPGSTICEDHIDTVQKNVVLKFCQIPTRIAGEDAF